MSTLLICGSRFWDNLEAMVKELETWPADTHLVHGDCRGADKMADTIGRELGWKITAYPAQWKLHGKAAGPIRNRQMLNESSPDYVLAFHSNIENSKGTKDMISYAQNKGYKVKLITGTEVI